MYSFGLFCKQTNVHLILKPLLSAEPITAPRPLTLQWWLNSYACVCHPKVHPNVQLNEGSKVSNMAAGIQSCTGKLARP